MEGRTELLDRLMFGLRAVLDVKNRPRYSRDGATRAEIQLCQKSGGGGFEPLAFFLGAIHPNLQRHTVVQAEHTHETLGIDPCPVVAYQNAKGLDSGKLHKVLNILKGMQKDIKMLHGFLPPVLYKSSTFVYNW